MVSHPHAGARRAVNPSTPKRDRRLPTRQVPAGAAGWTARLFGGLLCLGVSAVHVIDQNGIAGDKSPQYLAILYWILEIAGVVAALLLVAGLVRLGWLLALLVAAGPILGYVLSRGPGLPDYDEDVGNWTETLGLASLALEGLLLLTAAVCMAVGMRKDRRTSA
ncbi:hypothetical protein ACFV3R_18910 [Streptomyces sp. NPDC059740]|uniref:hypothetical protein n=1 Tax=Streptomyces sp. NPDC059740 TaxID=3346926 RepID=UPI003665C20B